MKLRSVLVTSICFFFSTSILGQGLKNQLEIKSNLQWDKYPEFSVRVSSVSNSVIKLKGTSWGIGANYMYSLKDMLFIKAGIGYYKYSFNKVEETVGSFGTSPARRINYEGGSSTFGYTCNRYWYNTISATVGVEKQFSLKKSMDITSGFHLTNYYTFSQTYNIPATNSDIKYKKTDGRYLGFDFNIFGSVQKKIGKSTIGPTVGFPIFKMWKQDSVFPPEQDNKSRNKWLNGLELGFAFKYLLTRKSSK